MSFIFSVWCFHVASYNSTCTELTRETLENGTSKRIQIDPYDLTIIWLITELGHSPTIAVLKIVIEHGQVVFSSLNYNSLQKKWRGAEAGQYFHIFTYLSFKQSNNYEKREALLIFHQETSVPHLCECPYQGPTLERHSNQPDSFTSLSLFSCYCWKQYTLFLNNIPLHIKILFGNYSEESSWRNPVKRLWHTGEQL